MCICSRTVSFALCSGLILMGFSFLMLFRRLAQLKMSSLCVAGSVYSI